MPSIFIQPNQLPWILSPLAGPIEGDLFKGSSVLDFAIVGATLISGVAIFAIICSLFSKDEDAT